MNNPQTNIEDFSALLEQLETCAVRPVVPGELPKWLAELHRNAAAVAKSYGTNVKSEHQRMLAEISNQDLGLAARCDELSDSHRQLGVSWQQLVERSQQLKTEGKRTELYEVKLERQVESLRDVTLKLVIETRKHEASIATWFAESFNRDRGVAD